MVQMIRHDAQELEDSPKDSGVVLLQQGAGLVVNGDAVGVDLFFQVRGVAQPVHRHQQPSVTQPGHTAEIIFLNGDVVAQLVERLPKDPMDAMIRGLNPALSTRKICEFFRVKMLC